jgi:putative DNA primase/helicase
VDNGSVRKLELDKNNYLFYQLNYDYDDSAICPQFSAFLNQVLPSATAQAVIAETIGSTFIPNEQLKLEKMPVLIGKGANGKSVLLEIIKEVLGENNVSHIGISSLTTNEQAKAGLRNKLLNIDSEMTSVFNRINYEELKKIISGEPIQVKLLFKDMFKISNYAKMIAACNELPPHEHTNAFARRLLVVPFNITIPLNKQDPQLAYKIKTTEMAGIFNWVLQGFMRIARQKHFTESREIIAAGIEYAIDSDSVQQYIRDGLELVPATDDPSNFFGLSTLFRNYVAYCAEVGLKPVSRRTMEKRLIAAGCGRDPRGFYFKTHPKEMQRNLDINDLPI